MPTVHTSKTGFVSSDQHATSPSQRPALLLEGACRARSLLSSKPAQPRGTRREGPRMRGRLRRLYRRRGGRRGRSSERFPLNQAAVAIGCAALGRAPPDSSGLRPRPPAGGNGGPAGNAGGSGLSGPPVSTTSYGLASSNLQCPRSVQTCAPSLATVLPAPGVPPGARPANPQLSPPHPAPEHLAGSRSTERTARGCTPPAKGPSAPGRSSHRAGPERRGHSDPENLSSSRPPRAAAAR